jgi:hypothetical protein
VVLSVWESSVVVALRDTQWMRADPVMRHPDEYLALSGDVEPITADAIYLSGDRLFLFEVKGTSANIREEWMRKKNDVYSPKPVHTALMDEVRKFPSKQQSADIVRMSMRCHYFAYWSSSHVHGEETLGELAIAPYVLASLKGLRGTKSAAGLARSGFDADSLAATELALRGRFPLTVNEGGTSGWQERSAIRIDVATSTFAAIFESSDPLPTKLDLGLEVDEFYAYIQFLSGGRDDSEMRAVVLSREGKYFRYVSSLHELVAIFKPPSQKWTADAEASPNVPYRGDARRGEDGPT